MKAFFTLYVQKNEFWMVQIFMSWNYFVVQILQSKRQALKESPKKYGN